MDKLESNIIYLANELGYKNVRQYKSICNFLLQGLSLKNKRVLEIGCGKGNFALWAALHGADYVLGIEPESDGSTKGVLATFRSIVSALQLDNSIEATNNSLEDIDSAKTNFDIVIMYNVINHLNEDAVLKLHRDPNSEKSYLNKLAYLRNIVSPGGILIVSDCGRKNFWFSLGLKSPLAKTIEWNKHQQPEVWRKLFRQVGFEFYDLRWTPIYPFNKFTGNYLIQYFTKSHFCLRLYRP